MYAETFRKNRSDAPGFAMLSKSAPVVELSALATAANKPRYTVASAAKSKNSDAFMEILGKDNGFDDFMREAYNSHDGYAIRINPVTGEKEMAVAGTRHASQWGLNLYDTAAQGADGVLNFVGHDVLNTGWHTLTGDADHMLPDIPVPHMHLFESLDRPRKNKAKYLSQIANENGVTILYGHSRGGALIADMKVSGATKVGLDAGMIMTHNNSMLNIEEGGTGGWGSSFDAGLAFSGENNWSFDEGKSGAHRVWSKGSGSRQYVDPSGKTKWAT